MVLDASSGRELTATPQDLKLCSADIVGPAACTAVTATAAVQKHLAIVERLDLEGMADLRRRRRRPAVLDRSGKSLDLGVTGQIYAISNNLAVFSPTGVDQYQQGGFVVHALAG